VFNLTTERSRRCSVNADVACRLHERWPNYDLLVVVVVRIIVVAVTVVVVGRVFVPFPVAAPVQTFRYTHSQTLTHFESILVTSTGQSGLH